MGSYQHCECGIDGSQQQCKWSASGGGDSLGTSIIEINDLSNGEPDDDSDKIIYIGQESIGNIKF